MTDITALMATMKAAAEKASNGSWVKESGDGWEASCSDNDQANGGFIIAHFEGPDAAANREFVQAASPANVKALVEALEKAQRQIQAHERAELTWMNALALPDDASRNDILPTIHAEKYALREATKRIAELESRTVTVKLPAMNDDLIAILGRPNFMCAHLAELLRKSGEDIKRKAEHEQAAVIHWFLGLYLEHGEKWESVAKSDIQRRAAGIQVIEGDAPQGV